MEQRQAFKQPNLFTVVLVAEVEVGQDQEVTPSIKKKKGIFHKKKTPDEDETDKQKEKGKMRQTNRKRRGGELQ